MDIKINTHLFIGGPADGKWLEVPTDRLEWNVLTMEKPIIRAGMAEEQVSMQSVSATTTIYRRQWMTCGKKGWSFFTAGQTTVVDAIDLLFQGYAPEKKDR